MTDKLGTIRGLGGAFLLSPDPKKLAAWYESVLGMAMEEYGGGYFVVYPVRDHDDADLVRQPVFAIKPAPDAPGPGRSCVVALRTDDIEALRDRLRSLGYETKAAHTVPGVVKITWVTDPEGNEIELAEELFPD